MRWLRKFGNHANIIYTCHLQYLHLTHSISCCCCDPRVPEEGKLSGYSGSQEVSFSPGQKSLDGSGPWGAGFLLGYPGSPRYAGRQWLELGWRASMPTLLPPLDLILLWASPLMSQRKSLIPLGSSTQLHQTLRIKREPSDLDIHQTKSWSPYLFFTKLVTLRDLGLLGGTFISSDIDSSFTISIITSYL